MRKQDLQQQRKLINKAISSADEARLRRALQGTIHDAQSFCWATLRQFDRRGTYKGSSTPQDYGLKHAEYHMLVGVADDAVSHVKWIERLLVKMDEPRELPPDGRLRQQLREARNLLAVHRDERVLYWRLTDEHTPRVKAAYGRLGLELPDDSIDTEIIAYFPPPGATDDEIEDGFASIGTVGGGLLSLRDLYFAFKQLETELDELAQEYRP
ncbi:MAG: hypothetical protein F4Z00_11165 [Acidimicrobiaceae bacterium]|nr:hypothetical protein [Acidimicrobiaceae bacterium]MXZ66088.1 hypothetical protein [Acidimicrobiaceae bacterium]MYF33021.1 hypothetical protein [Acidimicrobiaceae bacterium]MYG79676.1 hypothetical protein [Acidimicrobiaceae bacterium]MYJ28672.1 hypothetical protein [Acidimicrobiaceae bacterium]